MGDPGALSRSGWGYVPGSVLVPHGEFCPETGTSLF